MLRVTRSVVFGMFAVAVGRGCTKPRGTACPAPPAIPCVGEEVCTFDEGQGCHVCQCEPLDDELDGPGPDDRSQPPETRRPDSY